MPNIKSAERRMRVEAKANLRNRVIKSELKTIAKKFAVAVEAGDKTAAAELYKEFTGALDKAALKGTLHKNTVNRKKAQITKAFSSLTA